MHLLVEDVCGHDANCQRTHSRSTHPFEICRGSPHTASRSFSSRNTFTPGRANRTTHVQTATDNVAKQWSDQQRTRSGVLPHGRTGGDALTSITMRRLMS